MIRVIDASNKALFAHSLDQLFRLRHDCFVKERGWREFDKDGVYEQDQYDNDNAAYLAALDEHSDVVGCMRIYPTILPHMLSEQFSHLIDGPVPSSEHIIEMTRLAIRPGKRRGRAYHELMIGVYEYCLTRQMIGATVLMRWLRMPLVHEIGFVPDPLGPVHIMDNDPVIPVLFPVNEAVLERVRKRTDIPYPVTEDSSAPFIQKSA